MKRLSDDDILRIARDKKGFEVSWQWRNDGLRAQCRRLMNTGYLVMTYSSGFDRFEITEKGKEKLQS